MPEKEYIPIKDDFFIKPIFPLEKARLAGSRCRKCGEVFLGKAVVCQQCLNNELEDIALSRQGTLHAYTVARNRPPGDYKGPDNPFVPFAIGLVELPEGIRIISPLDSVDLDNLRIGIELELSIEELYTDEAGKTVVAFKFRPRKMVKGKLA